MPARSKKGRIKNLFTKSSKTPVRQDEDIRAPEDEAKETASLSELSSGDSSKNVENKERGNWGNSCEFLLSCVGYAVGIGNIWRFPYLCMTNGGGAFLIPYFFFLFTCGIPLFFLELALGQFSSTSPLTIWSICPLFKGLGYASTMVSGISCLYYNVIISWVLFYLFNSFTSDLPWTQCQNTSICRERDTNATNATGLLNMTLAANTSKLLTPAEEYWTYSVLKLSPGIDQLGPIRWQLMLCLMLAWVLVFLCLSKGIETSGKVVYVTATAPYVFLTILLIRGLTLDGAMDGIMFFLTPDFEMLAKPGVWGVAAIQIFYSLGPAWGTLITMASYNKFHNNVFRDALIVPCVNCLTSLYGGFVIFSVIGFMAKEARMSVQDVITQGPGLAFVAYPEALTKLPISPMWAVFFFLMLLTIGLDSQFAMFETLLSGLFDQFPRQLRSRKMITSGACSLLMFILGLPLVTHGGLYVFQIIDWYMGAVTLMLVAALECVVIPWIYGATRFRREIAMMTHRMPSFVWEILWRFITPVVVTAVLIYNLQGYKAPTNGDYEYPGGAIALGWIIALLSAMPIPGYMIYILAKTEGSFIERIRKQLKPDPSWGPWLAEYRENYDYLTGPTKPLEYYRKAKRMDYAGDELLDTKSEFTEATNV